MTSDDIAVSFLKSYPQPVQIIDESGWTIAVSDSFLSRFNLDENQIIGEGTHSFFDDQMLKKNGLVAAAKKAFAGEAVELAAVVIPAGADDSDDQAFKIVFFALNILEKKCLGIVYQDVSGYSAMHENVARKEDEIESFIYSVSHDLKSPMNVILNSLDIIFDPEMQENTEFVQKQKSVITRNVRFMQRFLDAILGFSRAGRKVTSKNEPNIPTNLIVRSVFADIKTLNTDIQAELVVGDLPELYLHPDDVMQLFQNLISNSFKYRAADRDLQLEVKTEKIGGNTAFVYSDNCSGMNIVDQRKAFDVFYRGGNITDDPKLQGSGLGLSIVAKIVKKVGGKVWLKSEPGVGTTFYFTIPNI